jgi:hypothetical protein
VQERREQCHDLAMTEQRRVVKRRRPIGVVSVHDLRMRSEWPAHVAPSPDAAASASLVGTLMTLALERIA